MNIFTYWQSIDGSALYPYLKLCRHTWGQCIESRDLVIINHDNLRRFLPARLLNERFFSLPLAIQSDVVSIYMLAKHGGLFLDTDTIMVKNSIGNLCSGNKLTAFGYPDKKSIHLAILACQNAGNALLEAWLEVITFRLCQPLPEQLPWDYMGNAIVGVLMQSGLFDEHYDIIDAVASGNILEATAPGADAWQRYINYYFKSESNAHLELGEDIKNGLISLHNSWTPEAYKKFSLESIHKSMDACFLSRLLLGVIEYNKKV